MYEIPTVGRVVIFASDRGSITCFIFDSNPPRQIPTTANHFQFGVADVTQNCMMPWNSKTIPFGFYLIRKGGCNYVEES